MVEIKNSNFNYSAAEREDIPCNLCGGREYRLLARRDQSGLEAETRLCLNCGLIYLSPRMTAEWYRRYYEEAYRHERARAKGRNEAAAVDLEARFEKGRKFGSALADLVRPYVLPGVTIEVGSSAGGLLSGFSERIPGIQPMGVEPSSREAAYASSRGIPTEAALLEELKTALSPASNIVCARSLNHLLDPRRFFAWAHGQLLPGGKLILAVLDFRHAAKKLGSISKAVQIDHPFMYTAETLRLFVEAAGFDVEFMDVNENKSFRELRAMRGSGLTGQHMRLVAARSNRAPFADSGAFSGRGPAVMRSLSRVRLAGYSAAYRAHRMFYGIRARLIRAPGKIARMSAMPVSWILVAAFLLRLWGAGYALPQFFVNDERAIVYGAFKMMELKTVLPVLHQDEFRKVLNYLPLPSYFYLVTLSPIIGVHYLFSDAANLAEYSDRLAVDSGFIFIAARILMALVGTLNVFAVYLFAKRLFLSERAGLLAALFLAVSFFHVQLSHVTRQWMSATLLVSLAWLSALEVYRRGRRRDYLLGGLFSGLAVGANTAAAVAMIPPALAHFVSSNRGRFFTRLREPALYAMLAVFFLISIFLISLYPYGLTQGESTSGEAGPFLAAKFEILRTKSLGGWLKFLWFYVRLLWRYETTLLVAAALGMAAAFRKNRAWLFIIGLFIAAYLTILYLFFNEIPRGMIFLLPPLAALAGFAADRIVLKFQSIVPPTRVVFVFLFSFFSFLFFVWPFAIVLRYDYLLTQADTRIMAKEWIEREIPDGTRVLAYLPNLRLANTKGGILEMEAIDPLSLRAADKALLRFRDSQYPQPAYSVLNLHFVGPDAPERKAVDPDFFKQRGYRYLAVEYEFRDKRDLDPQARSLLSGLRLVKRFDQFGDENSFYVAVGGVNRRRSIDIRGEVDMVPPHNLFFIDRFGPIVEVYAL